MATKNKTTIIAEKGKQDLFIIREFEAPRELVFQAFNDPDMLLEWMGPKEMTMRIVHMDNRTGGSYRYVHVDPVGNEYGFNGAVHEVTAPERIIRTFEFEGLPERGHVALETALFEVLPNNRTKVTVQSVFKSVEDRDGMVMSGMERGVNDSHERLDAIFAKTTV